MIIVRASGSFPLRLRALRRGSDSDILLEGGRDRVFGRRGIFIRFSWLFVAFAFFCDDSREIVKHITVRVMDIHDLADPVGESVNDRLLLRLLAAIVEVEIEVVLVMVV